MEKRNIVFIINPISGAGSKKNIPDLIEHNLDTNKFEFKIMFTEHAGHGYELAADAAEDGADVVVAVGGDGTVNEIARALIHTNTALGIIPCGSGNGLARHLTIPINIRGALQVINECEIHDLDFGRINDIPFFCTCGMGFDAVVSMKFAEANKRGLASYMENAFAEVVKYHPESYEIEDETGRKHYKAFLIACANASQWGNNAFIAPHASMSDGLMDVTIVEPFTAIEAPELSFQLFSKAIDRNNRIKMFRSRKIIIHRSKPGPVHFDGDPLIEDKDVVVEMVPKGIKVVVNPDKHPIDNVEVEKKPFDNVVDFVNNVYDVRDDMLRTSHRLQIINKVIQRRLLRKLKLED